MIIKSQDCRNDNYCLFLFPLESVRFGLKSHQDYEHGCPLTPINIDRPFKPRILIFSTSLSEDTSELVMMSFRTENLDISSQLLDWCGRYLATMLRPDREQLSAVSENLSAPALSSARARQHSVCFFVRLRDTEIASGPGGQTRRRNASIIPSPGVGGHCPQIR